jgi:hypothetical protein
MSRAALSRQEGNVKEREREAEEAYSDVLEAGRQHLRRCGDQTTALFISIRSCFGTRSIRRTFIIDVVANCSIGMP